MSDYSFPEYIQTLTADCYADTCPQRENKTSSIYHCDNMFCTVRCTIRYPWQKDTDIIYMNHT